MTPVPSVSCRSGLGHRAEGVTHSPRWGREGQQHGGVGAAAPGGCGPWGRGSSQAFCGLGVRLGAHSAAGGGGGAGCRNSGVWCGGHWRALIRAAKKCAGWCGLSGSPEGPWGERSVGEGLVGGLRAGGSPSKDAVLWVPCGGWRSPEWQTEAGGLDWAREEGMWRRRVSGGVLGPWRSGG